MKQTFPRQSLSVRLRWVGVSKTLTLGWNRGFYYRAFSLTWSASVQIYRNKRKRLHKKRVQLPKDWFGTQTWPPFFCFGTPIWPPWRHVKTLYSFVSLSVSWFGYGKQQKLKQENNGTRLRVDGLFIRALSSFQIHTKTEVVTWSCLKLSFSSCIQSTAFSKIQIGRSKNTFSYFPSVSFKLVLDLIKEKPLSRRFTYLEELALKVVVLQSKLEADTDEPE